MTSYIIFEHTVKIHDELVSEYGGRLGVLNEGLLKFSRFRAGYKKESPLLMN